MENPLFVDLEQCLRSQGAMLVGCADLLVLPEEVRPRPAVGRLAIGVVLAPRDRWGDRKRPDNGLRC